MTGSGGGPPSVPSDPTPSIRSPSNSPSVPPPALRHLQRLSGPFGLFEHARGPEPCPEWGYCTDDNGRALALACRVAADPYAEELADRSLRFLERAHLGNGCFRLRLGAGGRWTTDPPSDDGSGRALLGLGVAAVASPWEAVRRRAEALFVQAASFRSPWPRATAYVVLGVAEVARSASADAAVRGVAHRLLAGAVEALPLPGRAPRERELGRRQRRPAATAWRWPEPRLTYANALLPSALLAAGEALGREELVAGGLHLLTWLVDEEMLDGRFSFAPVGGRGPDGPKPAWDQQPIEAGAMAHACARALRLSGEKGWHAPLEAALWWWLGRNDGAATVWDPVTGGSYDGLVPGGVNTNQGAESTIAFVGAMALAQAVAASASSRPETEAVAAPT